MQKTYMYAHLGAFCKKNSKLKLTTSYFESVVAAERSLVESYILLKHEVLWLSMTNETAEFFVTQLATTRAFS